MADSAPEKPLPARLFLHGLIIPCYIGVTAEERRSPQEVIADIDLFVDAAPAVRRDALDGAVDYQEIRDRLGERFRRGKFVLLETLAYRIAQTCREFPGVKRVRVRLEKPGALRGVRHCGVELEL